MPKRSQWLAITLLVLTGCALGPDSLGDGRIVYRSANGEWLIFERDQTGDDSTEFTTCFGDVCFGLPDCVDAGYHCVRPFGSPLLAVPKNISTIPPLLSCDADRSVSWSFDRYAYKASGATLSRSACPSPFTETTGFVGQGISTIKVSVHDIGSMDDSPPLTTFLYSRSHGIVAIDMPFSNDNDSRTFRAYWLASPLGLLHAEPHREPKQPTE